MEKLSDLVSLDLVLATIKKLSNKYEELESIADTSLSVEYSRNWYAEYHASKNKKQVLDELFKRFSKISEENVLIPRNKLLRKNYYVLYYHDDVVAVINPEAVTFVDASSQIGCVSLSSRIYYREYDELNYIGVRFYGWYAKLQDVDIKTIEETVHNTIVWDKCPVVDNISQADNIADHIRDKWLAIKRKYNQHLL